MQNGSSCQGVVATSATARRRLRICLLNPTHTAIGSRIPSDHLPPLGLLAVGGPLLDDGFAVRLVDADRAALSARDSLVAVLAEPVDVVMIGHAGSSSAHRTALNLALRLKRLHPRVIVVYGGVHPTYHWREVLLQCKAIDFVVRGEGERTTRDLLRLLEAGADFRHLPGIAWREANVAVAAPRRRCWSASTTGGWAARHRELFGGDAGRDSKGGERERGPRGDPAPAPPPARQPPSLRSFAGPSMAEEENAMAIVPAHGRRVPVRVQPAAAED